MAAMSQWFIRCAQCGHLCPVSLGAGRGFLECVCGLRMECPPGSPSPPSTMVLSLMAGAVALMIAAAVLFRLLTG